jgi:hypothetical protein
VLLVSVFLNDASDPTAGVVAKAPVVEIEVEEEDGSLNNTEEVENHDRFEICSTRETEISTPNKIPPTKSIAEFMAALQKKKKQCKQHTVMVGLNGSILP